MRLWRILPRVLLAACALAARATVPVGSAGLAVSASLEAPAFDLAAAEQVARAALAKEPGARETVTLRSRAGGRFLALEGEKPVASAPGYVFLAERARSTRGRDGTRAPRRAVLLFVAGSRQGPEVVARRELELPKEAAGRGRRIRPEAKLERWQLTEGSGALVVQVRWPEGGEGTGHGDDTSTVYVLTGKSFREVLSIVTRTSGPGATPEEAGGEDTYSQETTAVIEILPEHTRGLRDIQVTAVTERLSGCWHGNQLGPCPPDPGVEEEKGRRDSGSDARAEPNPAASEEDRFRRTGEPEVTRYCWGGTAYVSGDCEP
jgi:hypothetical protein